MEALVLLGLLAGIVWLLHRRSNPKKSLEADGTGWWYLKDDRTIGTVTIDTLREILIRDPDADAATTGFGVSHRRAHHAQDAWSFNRSLIIRLAKLEPAKSCA
jgi:hypothetical protein